MDTIQFKKCIGYITMTFDTPHEGHYHVLKAASELCDILIVGLTTDETAIKQKRKPLQSWENRKAILEQCKYVNIVLPHNGEKKSRAWKCLKFHKCFTCTEEYFDTYEFDELRKECPQVEIIGISRYPNQSSISILNKMKYEFLKETQVITTGITGPIFRQGDLVWKTLSFGQRDLEHKSKDNYGFFQYSSLPRNYKHIIINPQPDTQPNTEIDSSFPFISGINPGREIWLNHHFKNRPWSVFEFFSQEPNYPAIIDIEQPPQPQHEQPQPQQLEPRAKKQKQEANDEESKDEVKDELIAKEKVIQEKEIKSLREFANYIKWERKFGKHTCIVVMRYGGQTLRSFLENSETQPEDVKQIIRIVLNIIAEIRDEGILHGDIHANNILVDYNVENQSNKKSSFKISLIDWGWSSSYFFHLDKMERNWLIDRLEENWDAKHFLGSLLNFFPKCEDVIRPFLFF